MTLMTRISLLLCLTAAIACGKSDSSTAGDDPAASAAPTGAATEAPAAPAKPSEPAAKGPDGLDCEELHRKAASMSQTLSLLKQLEHVATMDPTQGPEPMLRNVRESITAVQAIPGADEARARLAELGTLIDEYIAADADKRGPLTQAIMDKASPGDSVALAAALVRAGCP